MLACVTTVVLAVLASGCGRQTVTVSGDVTLDGQPVTKGTITYVPVDTSLPRVEREIVDGKYTAPLPVGAYKVQVSWQRPTGKKRQMLPDSPAIDILEEAVPGKFNTNTELQTDIKAGDTKRDWPLKSK
jgi:hypothetical protein